MEIIKEEIELPNLISIGCAEITTVIPKQIVGHYSTLVTIYPNGKNKD